MEEIRFQFVEPEIDVPDDKVQPASYLRKEFFLEENPQKAMLYLTALGVYKAYINGHELDEQMLLPGFTNYQSRVQYQSYNVTEWIRQGENVLAVILADGWYRGVLGGCFHRRFYGDKIKFAAKLNICGLKGEKVLETDETWQATQDGPILESDIKLCETVDARKELVGWKEPGYKEKGWHPCVIAKYSGICIPQQGEKLLEQEVFSPKLRKTPNGEILLDFGQNHAGHVEFTVNGHAGTAVVLEMGEVLDENGNFTIKNVEPGGDRKEVLGQKLTYTLSEGKQTYRSVFLVSGYRYVRLSNWPEEIAPQNFRSYAIYSNWKPCSEFSCSNEKINQLYQNSVWSFKSNTVDIPTDCPTRERAGWTGDINVFADTAFFYGDMRRFLKKWLGDFISLQQEDGNLPFIVPEIPFVMAEGKDMQRTPFGSAGWSDALIHVPIVMYRYYGDDSAICQVYDTAKKFVDFNLRRAKKRNWSRWYKFGRHNRYILDTGFHFGEWLEPGMNMIINGIRALIAPDAEVATAWFYQSAKEVAEMARLLEKKEDESYYSHLAEQIRVAYRKEFFRGKHIHSKRVCKYVRPLAMGLIDGEEAREAAEELNRKVIAQEYKIHTGFLTTCNILQVLSDYGFTDTAYRMLLNEECPGWMYEIKKGATTIWENWQGIDDSGIPRDSMNHYALSGNCAWLFSHCAGIRPLKPGFSKVEIKPLPGGGLTWAKAVYESISGTISVEWKIQNNIFFLHVQAPKKIELKICLPDQTTQKVSGKTSYDFSCGGVFQP